MYEVLSLMIILFSASEKIVSNNLLRSNTLDSFEEKNPLALFLLQRVGPTRTYLSLFFLSVLFVWITYEYAQYSILVGTFCLLGELIFLIGVFINNCAWKVLHTRLFERNADAISASNLYNFGFRTKTFFLKKAYRIRFALKSRAPVST